ncbi:WYL domain-containing protein [Devosia lacusdianchii]|uniref:WYL domain-containing protein n=1 Tax=Devosia lacusdianchii TaxID=2917991 RepID=UPI001F06787A|nr:WYL domain-containing protein [Devosia sp. JXJ CY 41]
MKQKWTIERRLAFIEFRLQWDGRVNRTDVATKFGISLNQATNDLVAYAKAEPQNIRYDLSLRAYVRGDGFNARYGTSTAEHYLAQLLATRDARQQDTDLWIGQIPEVEVIATPVGPVSSHILRSIVGAVLTEEPIDCLLQTERDPRPCWDTIAPHAMLMDGAHWSVRAYSQSIHGYATIPLARIVEMRGANTPLASHGPDEDWSTIVELRVAPQSNLTEADRNTLIRDLGIKGESTSIKVRRALIPQLAKRLGISTPSSPADRLVILNVDDADVAGAVQ